MSPLIGITPHFTEEDKYSLNVKYATALKGQGATLLILPYDTNALHTYLKILSGIVLSGGGDIDPLHFKEPPHEKTGKPTPARDHFELELCRAAIDAGIPLLGICRGVQTLNVALGGNLIQHIDGHSQGGSLRSKPVHNINIYPNTKLRAIIGQGQISVNSIHHQVVGDKLGKGLKICATDPQGIIEAIELPRHRFALGVQWHPEELAASHLHHAALFNAFLDAAKNYYCETNSAVL